MSLPATLEIGGSIEVNVSVNIIVKGYVNTAIEIGSSLGTQTVSVKINENLISDVAENNAANFEVYPNPTSTTLFVKGNDIQSVTIFNAVGQQVLYVENRNEINVESLNEGVYFVRISDVFGNSIVKKIVKSF